jgi:hypothetical protein
MKTISTHIGGEPVRWERESGTFCLVTFTNLPDGRLQQMLRESDGTRENTFMLTPDGKEMTFETLIHSKRLDTPIHFMLRYKREKP